MRYLIVLLGLLCAGSAAFAATVLDRLEQRPPLQLMLPVAALDRAEASALRGAGIGDVVRFDSLTARFAASTERGAMLTTDHAADARDRPAAERAPPRSIPRP